MQIILSINTYEKASESDFVLIEKEVKDGINKKIQYGLVKK